MSAYVMMHYGSGRQAPEFNQPTPMGRYHKKIMHDPDMTRYDQMCGGWWSAGAEFRAVFYFIF